MKKILSSMSSRNTKFSGGITSFAVIIGSVFLASGPKALLEAIIAPDRIPASSEADTAFPSRATPSSIEIAAQSLIDNRLSLMTRMECDLTMRQSSIEDLMSRIHLLKLYMMLNPIRSDFSQLIEQHNELVNRYHRECSQYQRKHAEYEKLIGQADALLRLYNVKHEESARLE
jgi:hypothetical protein